MSGQGCGIGWAGERFWDKQVATVESQLEHSHLTENKQTADCQWENKPMNKQEKCHCSQHELQQKLFDQKTVAYVPLLLFRKKSRDSSEKSDSEETASLLTNLLLPLLRFFPRCRKWKWNISFVCVPLSLFTLTSTRSSQTKSNSSPLTNLLLPVLRFFPIVENSLKLSIAVSLPVPCYPLVSPMWV